MTLKNKNWENCLCPITVKPTLTTTSEQRPPINNGQFDSSTINLNLTFIRPFFPTTTFFRSQGWSLYTGLTEVTLHLVFCRTWDRSDGNYNSLPRNSYTRWYPMTTKSSKSLSHHNKTLFKIIAKIFWTYQETLAQFYFRRLFDDIFDRLKHSFHGWQILTKHYICWY